jgi:NAD(P)-dependent dehydrogenase (short-subunit alcohol dehydrogenase family)
MTKKGRHLMGKAWSAKDIPSQAGKRVIVTGATNGIGWNMALELARAGAEVTIPARTHEKAEDAVRRIRARVPFAKLNTAIMDLTSLASVRSFAERELTNSSPIDTLINNAGVMAVPTRKLSVDGFEIQLATNVLGHFLLTGILLPAVLRARAPRVVTVASYAHTQGGPTPLTDLNSETSYEPVRAYSKTKLANVLFARELQRRAGSRLLSASCHPGYARTNLQFNGETISMQIVAALLLPFSHSSAQGAEPALFAATSPDAKPGAYYGPGGLFGLSGPVKETKMAPFAYDDAAAGRLFDELEQMAHIRFDFGTKEAARTSSSGSAWS